MRSQCVNPTVMARQQRAISLHSTSVSTAFIYWASPLPFRTHAKTPPITPAEVVTCITTLMLIQTVLRLSPARASVEPCPLRADVSGRRQTATAITRISSVRTTTITRTSRVRTTAITRTSSVRATAITRISSVRATAITRTSRVRSRGGNECHIANTYYHKCNCRTVFASSSREWDESHIAL